MSTALRASAPTAPKASSAEAIVSALSNGLTTLCEVLLVVMAALVTASIVARSVAGISWGFTEQWAGFLLAAVTFLGLPGAQRADTMFRVDTVFVHLPPRWRGRLALLWDLAAAAFVLILAVQLALHTYSTFGKGTASADAHGLPLWMPQLVMPVGLVLLLLTIVTGLRRSRGAGAHTEVGTLS